MAAGCAMAMIIAAGGAKGDGVAMTNGAAARAVVPMPCQPPILKWCSAMDGAATVAMAIADPIDPAMTVSARFAFPEMVGPIWASPGAEATAAASASLRRRRLHPLHQRSQMRPHRVQRLPPDRSVRPGYRVRNVTTVSARANSN
jgi:hypothetical protein